jgi:DnaJ homolog subfamily C member 3
LHQQERYPKYIYTYIQTYRMRTQQLLLRVLLFLSFEPVTFLSTTMMTSNSFVNLVSANAETTSSNTDTGGGSSNMNDISAGKLRSMADEAVMTGDYTNAISYLQQAIQMEPQSAMNYYKLYRIYYQRKRQYDTALQYIELAAQYDMKQYQPMKAKLLISLGQCDRAVSAYQELMKEHQSLQQQYETDTDYIKAQECDDAIQKANLAYFNEEYELAVQYYNLIQQYIEQGIDYIYPKAISLYYIGDYYGVISETNRLLKVQSQNIDAYELRGNAYYALGDHELAIAHYREGLKLDPEHKKCKEAHKFVKSIEKKYKNGQVAYDKGEYDIAITHWTAAIQIDDGHDVFNKPVQLKIAQAYSKLKQYKEAERLVQDHIDTMGETVEALWTLGEIQQTAEQFDEAVRSFHRAVEITSENSEQRNEAQQKLQQAQVALKQSKEKNYYKILNISRSATKKEIKKSYRELALKWHPDKNTDDTDVAEKMFQDISEAYEVLSDDTLKAKYDNGEEVFENQGGQQRHHHNAHQFFNQHFQQQQGGQRIHFRFN